MNMCKSILRNAGLFFSIGVLIHVLPAGAQSKVYFSGAITNVSGGGVNVNLGELDEGTFFKFDHYAFDLEYSTRLMGSFNFVTGLSFFNAGYDVESLTFGSASELKVSYLAVPLMIRWNISNKNIMMLDVGLAPSYLLKAHLSEHIYQFNTRRVSEGDITKYSNRFYFGYKIQMIIPINRVVLGIFYYGPIGGQTSLKNLDGHWGLNSRQSSYLLSEGYSNFLIIGLKAGIRIR
jgi:hypothetical protein